jgi:DNA-binding NarL/FixJ family response regulator
MDPYDTLSTREREVLKLLEAGRSEREIAEEPHAPSPPLLPTESASR